MRDQKVNRRFCQPPGVGCQGRRVCTEADHVPFGTAMVHVTWPVLVSRVQVPRRTVLPLLATIVTAMPSEALIRPVIVRLTAFRDQATDPVGAASGMLDRVPLPALVTNTFRESQARPNG